MTDRADNNQVSQDAVTSLTSSVITQIKSGSSKIYISSPHNLYLTDEQSILFENATTNNDKYKSSIDGPIMRVIEENLPKFVPSNDGRIMFIDLGPGFPSKSLIILDFMIKSGVKIIYHAVDVSPYFLDRAIAAVINREVPVVKLQRRFEELDSVLDRKLVPPAPRFIFMGLTFTNFDPEIVLGFLSSLIKPGDVALICYQPSDSIDEKKLLTPYTGFKVEKFAFQPIKVLGLKQEDFFYSPILSNSAVETTFTAKRDIPVGDAKINKGTSIVTSKSYRLPRNLLHEIISKHVRIIEEFQDSDGGVVLAKIGAL